MERHAHLPWDCVLSAELVKKYKPEPEPYLLAVHALGPGSEQVMYVAAHDWDLAAGAEKAGMRTAYIPRPKEIPGRFPILQLDTTTSTLATSVILRVNLACDRVAVLGPH